MDIGYVNAIGVTDKAADLDVLADSQHLVSGDVGDGAVSAGVLAVLQGLHVGGVLGGHHRGHVLDKALEDLVLGHKVGLGVDLNNHAHAAVGHNGKGSALGGHLAGLLDLGGEALLTQPLNGLVKVAVGLHQGLFAVHHANAGHLAQLLYVFRGNCHNHYLQINVKCERKAPARLGGR